MNNKYSFLFMTLGANSLLSACLRFGLYPCFEHRVPPLISPDNKILDRYLPVWLPRQWEEKQAQILSIRAESITSRGRINKGPLNLDSDIECNLTADNYSTHKHEKAKIRFKYQVVNYTNLLGVIPFTSCYI